MGHELLTPAELGAMIHKTTDALRGWRDRATGPQPTKIGGRVYYRREDVDTWLTEQAEASRRAWESRVAHPPARPRRPRTSPTPAA
nr:Excionase [uncultured bacterium]